MEKLNQYASSLLLASSLTLALPISTAHAAGCQVLSKSSLESKADNYGTTIRSAAHKYGVHEALVKAVITVESCFHNRARGTSGEKGLMQLMPATARRFSVKSGYNSWQNIHGGTRYLSYLLKRYNGDMHRAVAAYNAGEGNVRPGGRIHNRDYVNKVMRAYGKFSGKRLKTSVKTEKGSSRGKRVVSSRSLPWKDKRRSSLASASPASFKVQKGHTVYEVMRQTGVPVKRIISLNGLHAPFHLQTGQTLRLK